MTSVAAAGPGQRRDLLVDALIAVSVAAVTIGGTAGELVSATAPTPAAFGGYLIALAAAVPLLWRRRRPAVVAVAGLAIAASYPLIGYPGWAPMLPLFVAFFSLTAYATRSQALYGALALCVLAYLVPIVSTSRWDPLSPAVWAPAGCLVWVSFLGASARRRRLDGEERLRQVAEVAEVRASQRIARDRLQVAQELHDVLAHTISVIAVQSGLAVDAIEDDIETTRRALDAIRSSTREALVELRATVTLLRADANADVDQVADGARPTRPQPRLSDVGDLIDRAREAGLAATLHAEGAVGPVSPAVELTAYRVIQESLTNVIRHAQARSVAVTIDGQEASLRVTVVDDGRGSTDLADGFGVRGMRERVEALGGTLTTGPNGGQGHAVCALLPCVP